ncbi:hypothetical protein NLJ89_g9122 [Agrocybe chaxingu]|uniref:F-box domain-containing protein n=1 Tax=Agrocybe chaxingu TaxID=84603 RepID=A0A9W8JRD5_9AGAR|nr:hypothetical protein NLJ89_g9122 [Agrocybe chaxingu]
MLPNELMAAIFLCFLSSMPSKIRNTSLFVLLQVCRRWKSVAEGCPQLWAVILINDEHCHTLPTSYVHTFLKRSADSFLSISASIRNVYGLYSVVQAGRALPPLFAEARRWQDFELTLPDIADVPNLSLECVSAPHLRRIKFDCDGQVVPFAKAVLSESLGLRELSWRSPNTAGSTIATYIHGAELVHLNLHLKFSPCICLDILNRCPLLTECHLESISFPDAPDATYPPERISLPHLNILRLDGTNVLLDIIRRVILPALKTLNMIRSVTPHWSSPLPFQLSEVKHLLSRSNCSLEHLILDGHDFQEGDLIECLPMLPNLLTLETNQESAWDANAIIDKLNQTNSDDHIDVCPRLTKIRFTGKMSARDGAFSRMIEQRWGDFAECNRVAALNSVHVEYGFSNHHNELDVKTLHRLRSQGLLARVFVQDAPDVVW